jgi:hypothetical protein
MLFSTGLVAGGSIAGLLVAIFGTWSLTAPALGALGVGHGHDWMILGEGARYSALVACAVLCTILVRKSLKKLEI